MKKAHLQVVSRHHPPTIISTVPRPTPLRRPNAELRTREHLTEREVERLMKAVKVTNRTATGIRP